MIELRCPGCGQYLGESASELVLVDRVSKGEDVRVAPPRDIRLCRGCGAKLIFIPRADLELRITQRKAS